MVHAQRQHGRRFARQRGFSLPEVLIVTAILGLIVGISAAAWNSYRRSNEINVAAAKLRNFFYQARLLSVYRGTNHFVVVDAANRRLMLVEDSNQPLASWDSGDRVVSQETWPESVRMALPAQPSPLPSPIGGGNLTDAWSFPDPDSGAEWGSDLRGVMANAEGQFKSAELTPQLISIGAIVLVDDHVDNGTVSVGVEGLSGAVRAYRHDGTGWREL